MKKGKLADVVPQEVILEEDFAKYADPAAQLLAKHYKQGHLPFKKLLFKAKRKEIYPGHS